MSERSDLRNT